MTPIFADTFVFLAMINANDAAHAASVRLMNSLRNPLVTTTWVLTELADGLCARETRHLFLATDERIRGDNQFSVVPATQTLFKPAASYTASDPTRTGRSRIAFHLL